MIPETGPYLKTAVFCDQVIEGKDGVLSLVRAIDRLTITAGGPGAPEAMPEVRRPLKLVLMLVSGRARGGQNLEVKIETPDGTIGPWWSSRILFEGEDRGANVVLEVEQEFRFEGLYWFHLLLEGNQLTRIPFRVIYQRIAPGSQLR